MFTEDNNFYDDNQNENYDNEYNSMEMTSEPYEEDDKKKFPFKDVIIKVLIVFGCLLLIIWLVSLVKGGKKSVVLNDGQVLESNIEKIRLASEEYFFIGKNYPTKEKDEKTVSISDLGIQEVKDYNGKVCSNDTSSTYVKLLKSDIAYELTINLTCPEEVKNIVFYYDLKNGKCLSCNGNTKMDGSLSLDDDKNDNSNDSNNSNNSNNNNVNISCDDWSDWTTTKINDDNVLVKTRVIFKGYKKTPGNVVINYGKWSDWSDTLIVPNETLEVETNSEVVSAWSENKTTTNPVTASDTLKVLDVQTTGGGQSCSNVSTNVRADLTASTYQQYMASGLVVKLNKVYNKKVDGKYVLLYDTTYKKYTKKCSTNPTVTTYTYQELVSTTVTKYRSRAIIKVQERDTVDYTDYVETLPNGYTKVDGSEITQYSYKYNVCK